MSYQEFIIKTGTEGQPPRIGQIVESEANSPEFVVIWNDNGERESVRTSGSIIRAREGSLTYMLKTSPNSVVQKLEQEPIELFKSVLVDNNFAPKSNKEITEALVTRAKLDESSVSEIWKKNKPVLLALEEVSTQGTGGNVKYKIAKPNEDPLKLKKAKTSQKAATLEVEAETAEKVTQNADSSVISNSDSAQIDEIPQNSESDETREEIQRAETKIAPSSEAKVIKSEKLPQESNEEVSETKELPVTAVYVLGGLLGVHEPTDSTNILSSGLVVDYLLASLNKSETAKSLATQINIAPLSSGILLEDLSNKLIAGASKKLTKIQLGPIYAAALSRSKQISSLFPGFQDWLGTNQASKALNASVIEFDALSETPSFPQREALLSAFSRVLEVNPDSQLTFDAVLVGLVNSLLTKTEREVVSKNLTERFVKEVKENSKLVLEPEELFALGEALSEHRFSPTGPRASILAALGHTKPELVDNQLWWRGLDFEDLETLNTSPLGALLSKEPFASDIVSPLVRSEISSISTRKGISKLFAAPAFALEFVSPADIETVMNRVAKSDKNAKSWLEVLSRSELVVELKKEIAQSNEEANSLVEQNRKHLLQLEDLTGKIGQLQAQLDKGKSEAGALSARERRQISIDAYRDLARVTATIEGEAEKLSPEQLLAKVNALLDRSSISRSAEVGQQVQFDPRLHISPGGRPENGSLVTVLRSGYQWFDGQEDVVLVEALVSSVTD